MAKDRHRYIYRREREDGSANESISLKQFEKWLNEAEDSDRFYVARCDWVECQHDKDVPFGSQDIPHVVKVRTAEAKENK